MASKSSLHLTNPFIKLSKHNTHTILSINRTFAGGFASKFPKISSLNERRSKEENNKSESAVERELLGLERDDKINIQNDPRTEPDFPEIRVLGPKSQNTEYKSKTKHLSEKHGHRVYNRAGIEKPHLDWGWSPLNDRTASQWNWKDTHRANKDIPDSEKETWPNALTLLEDRSHKHKTHNPNDLTTFEGYSESSRAATFKAALNVGVHWGKEKSVWNTSMGPYLKGVVNGRHIFDITLIISNLRKVIRLLQSLIMDECNILFVCNSKDVEMRTLARIMCTRCNMPLLDDRWAPGSLTNWNHMAEHFRGPGRELTDGKRPTSKFWRKTKLHRLIRTPPDFIFLFNRSYNDVLVHEANRTQIPVASLCDSDDSTRDLQYVIPCNTQSIQSVHFVLDMLTRGILEAQSKMDSVWWSRQKDLESDRNALSDAEIEWQYKYDAYEQQRLASKMSAGDIRESENDLDIVTSYVKEDMDAMDTLDNGIAKKNIVIGKYGNAHSTSRQDLSGMRGDVSDFGAGLDMHEQARMDKLKGVMEQRSTEYLRRFEKNKGSQSSDEEFVSKFELPKAFQSASDFSMGMLQEHVGNQAKMRQRIANMTGKSLQKKK